MNRRTLLSTFQKSRITIPDFGGNRTGLSAANFAAVQLSHRKDPPRRTRQENLIGII